MFQLLSPILAVLFPKRLLSLSTLVSRRFYGNRFFGWGVIRRILMKGPRVTAKYEASSSPTAPRNSVSGKALRGLRSKTALVLGAVVLGCALGPVKLGVVQAACAKPASAEAPSSGQVNPAKVFTPVQRAAIVDIMRQALAQDPTILVDAVKAMREKAANAQAETDLKAVHTHWDQLSDAPSYALRGNPKGSVTVVEFLDPRCGYCRRMAPQVTDFLARHPNVRLVEKVVPILGPASMTATRAIYAAAFQGQYGAMRDGILLSPATPDEARLKKLARGMDLDVPRFLKDMNGPAVSALIASNLQQGQIVGLEGTPTFLFGQAAIIPGAVEPHQMDDALAQAVKAQAVKESGAQAASPRP